ncbi:MAG TPA: Gfo/Idh/MocA family oxidoreductase [Myxococcota bacterium]|nr:Gfo/Idh/MocA family oxidoreductase [Myxococcota bacterium]
MAQQRGGDEGRPTRVRYAVVGAGHIAQAAVLPAFRNARRNSELAAVVSGDEVKRGELGQKYRVATYDYGQLEACLRDERVEAVYLALPNHLHCEYTERSAAAGAHVLCEKPMAVTVEECDRMLAAAERAGVKLMVAYRLHFEPASLKAMELGRSGRLGELRLFDSTFSMQVREDDIRVDAEKGGGPLYDIGVYCIQAARMLFGAEPLEVRAMRARSADPRFGEVNEAVAAQLRFPGERLASFVCSFGAADVSSYRLVGTRGDLRVEPAYEYAEGLVHHLTLDGRTRTRRFAKRDQFAPELLHFSDAIRADRAPEPSGLEGKIDVQIIQALQRAAESGAAVSLPPLHSDRPPAPRQARSLVPVRKPALVRARSASQ